MTPYAGNMVPVEIDSLKEKILKLSEKAGS